MPPKQSLGNLGIMSSNTGHNAAWTLWCQKLPMATLVVLRDLQGHTQWYLGIPKDVPDNAQDPCGAEDWAKVGQM